MKCPYCGKRGCIPSVVARNIESYGSSSANFKCVHCSKVINTYGQRKVVFSKLKKTDNDSDWA